MCGRFAQAVPWSTVWAFSQPLAIAIPEEPLVPRYNIAPTQAAWVVAGYGARGAKAGSMRWGLVPGWAHKLPLGLSTFNTRAESAPTKPTFRHLLERRHFLVPAHGCCEWVGTGRAK
jgi:putative SOS response-associated peptidase YedK